MDFGLFLVVFNQKTGKIDKNEENLQNPNRLMKFSEIWYIDASQQKKCYKRTFFRFWPFFTFFGRFLTKKQPKLTKNEENWQNPNCLMKFSEIWYVNTSKQKKIQQKIIFSIVAFFDLFWPF